MHIDFSTLRFKVYHIPDPLDGNSPGLFTVIDNTDALPTKLLTDFHKESP